MIFRRKRKEEDDYYNETNIYEKEDEGKIIGIKNLVESDRSNNIAKSVIKNEVKDKEQKIETQSALNSNELEKLAKLGVNLVLKDKAHKDTYRNILITISMSENKLFRWLRNASYGITNKEIDEEGVKILESLKNAGLVEKVYRVEVGETVEGYSIEELTEKLMDRMHAVYKVRDELVKRFVISPPIKLNPEDVDGVVLRLIELGIAELVLLPKPYYIDKWLDVEIDSADKAKIIEELKKLLTTLPPDLANVVKLEK